MLTGDAKFTSAGNFFIAHFTEVDVHSHQTVLSSVVVSEVDDVSIFVVNTGSVGVALDVGPETGALLGGQAIIKKSNITF